LGRNGGGPKGKGSALCGGSLGGNGTNGLQSFRAKGGGRDSGERLRKEGTTNITYLTRKGGGGKSGGRKVNYSKERRDSSRGKGVIRRKGGDNTQQKTPFITKEKGGKKGQASGNNTPEN